MIIEESGLKFEFPENVNAIKYDDSNFYRHYINQLPESKGVDFLSVQDKRLIFTEVKNCKGHEADNNWRIYPDNRKLKTSHTIVDTSGRESLDIEVAKKVSLTIAGLVGAYTKEVGCESAEELSVYAKSMVSSAIEAGTKQLLVILFLEGDFGCESRRKTMIMRDLEASIRKKLSWLNCRVSVVDSNTYQKKIFRVS